MLGAQVELKHHHVLMKTALPWSTKSRGETMNRIATAVLISMLAAVPAFADDKHHADGLADGEVRKVDRDAGKLTIKHGPIPNLDMPPMTMVYRVKDPAMLGEVKPGDTIRFEAQKIGGQYTVTRIVSGK